MWTPMEANPGRGDDGIPAADPGAGAPPTADGFGVGGEEPDRPEEAGAGEASPEGAGVEEAGTEDDGAQATAGSGPDDDPPFRTPDPGEVGRG